MNPSQHRLVAAALVGLTVLSPAVARAQGFTRMLNPIGNQGYNGVNPFFRVSPNLTLPQFAFNAAVLGQGLSNIPPYALGYNPYQQGMIYGGGTAGVNPYGAALTANPYGANLNSMANPYAGGYGMGAASPYGSGSSYSDPYSGYLRGVADVTSANANYQDTIQKARLLNEQVWQTRAETRRHIFEEATYERMHTPTAEDLRVEDLTTALNRARRDPPLTEVWSGKALDDLFRHIAAEQGKGSPGPRVPLDEDVLKRINVTAGAGGNVGLLKADAKLQWPTPLQGSHFADARQRLDQVLGEAVQQAKLNQPVESGLLNDLQAALKTLNGELVQGVAELSPTQYIEAKRYLHQLGDAVRALSDPGVANYFTGKWVAKGKNVAELVKHMSDLGLTFAPAAPGDETAYRTLYYALASFDSNLGTVSRK